MKFALEKLILLGHDQRGDMVELMSLWRATAPCGSVKTLIV